MGAAPDRTNTPFWDSPLPYAVRKQNAELVRLLLDNGAEVNAPAASIHGRTALEGAVERGRLDILQLLLDAGAERNVRGDEQYRRAAMGIMLWQDFWNCRRPRNSNTSPQICT
ncbi:NF-kappa-B inhibitor beta [Metarhizium anisopliae]|nr:NF-kappa-B inhibitor beta [Metarhizium anisopliae]